MFQTLSVVVPVYNERNLLPQVLERIEAVELPQDLQKQIILVDDGSTDGTTELLREIARSHPHHTILFHEKNRGKGAALRTGFAAARGAIVIIQDADLEYDPAQYPVLLKPILNGLADVVYGSRFIGESHRVLYYWHSVGNKLLTMMSNMLSNVNLTDMECCYKVFRREVLEQIRIEENRFGFEPEITAKVARGNWRVYEVPISYHGRTYEEGKKIGWKDGVRALYVIAKYAAKR